MPPELPRIANHAPRWVGRALHLTVKPHPPYTASASIIVSPTELTLNGAPIPGTIVDVYLRAKREENASDRLCLRIEAEETAEIPCATDPHLGELVRILSAWADPRGPVRRAWGTPDLAAALVPRLTTAMQERAGILAVPEGLAVPLFGGGLWVQLRGLFNPAVQRLVIAGDGLLVRGERVPFEAITDTWTLVGTVVIETRAGQHRLETPRDTQAILAGLIEHLRGLPPDQVEAELDRSTT